MRRLIPVVIVFTMWMRPLPLSAQTEILDRVVAVVSSPNMRKIILLSDVQREREIQRAVGYRLNTDREVVDFLVERYLTEDQMVQFAGIEPNEQEIEDALREIPDQSGVDRSAVRDAVAREIKRRNYLQLRFGQFIHPTEQELKDYYEKSFVPDARLKDIATPPFEEAMRSPELAARLQRNVFAERMNHEVELWLESIKRRSDIEIF
jgi:hypothetical protein